MAGASRPRVEWVYTSRAGTTTAFSVGDSISLDQAHSNANSPYHKGERRPSPDTLLRVGRLAPNPWGFHDTHRNVSEWSSDYYHFDLPHQDGGHEGAVESEAPLTP